MNARSGGHWMDQGSSGREQEHLRTLHPPCLWTRALSVRGIELPHGIGWGDSRLAVMLTRGM